MRSAIACLNLFLYFGVWSVAAHAAQPTVAEVLAQLQIGPKWDKQMLSSQSTQNVQPALRKAALSIANFKHGTAFFIGILDGHYVMATNAHVVANRVTDLLPENIDALEADPKSICYRKPGDAATIERARFDLQKKSFECERLIGVWPSIELALFTIKVDKSDTSFFNEIELAFDFANPPMQGKHLASLGYGEFMNPGEPDVALMLTFGPYCKTFSPTGETRYMSDPDEHNPGPYKVWSIAVGCNIAWGDSGAPLLDPTSWRVVGLLWTASYPKIAAVHDSSYLDKTISNQSLEVWNQFSYASPSAKIREILSEDKSSNEFKSRILAALLAKSVELRLSGLEQSKFLERTTPSDGFHL